MYDIIIIGAGISGSFLASQFKHYNILIIEKENSCGGIWYQTKWSWLCSDTKGYSYSPYKNSKHIYDNHFLSGVPKDVILNLTNKYLENKNVQYNEKVMKVEFYDSDNYWTVYTDKDTYKTKWIINSTGLYQKPNIPSQFVEYLQQNNIKYVHSSEFNDCNVNENTKIAVIGSRESGVQIVKALSNNRKVDWYARSFNNWYFNSEKSSNIEKYLHRLYQLPIIGYIIYICMSFIKKYFLNKAHDFIVDTLFKHYSASNKQNKLHQAYYKVSDKFRYDFKNPVRPVFTSNLNFDNIDYAIFNESDYSKFKEEQYDLVILATGYTQNNPYEIYVNGEKKDVDLFYLVDYILPQLPNTIYCLPLAISTFIMLEEMSKKIINIIETNIDTNRKFILSDIQFDSYKKKVDAFLLKNKITKEQLCYHTRHPTLIYHPHFL